MVHLNRDSSAAASAAAGPCSLGRTLPVSRRRRRRERTAASTTRPTGRGSTLLVLLLLVVQRLQRALAGRVIRRLDLRVVHRGGGLMLLLVMRGARRYPPVGGRRPSSRHGRVASAYARCCCKDCSSKAFRAACLMTSGAPWRRRWPQRGLHPLRRVRNSCWASGLRRWHPPRNAPPELRLLRFVAGAASGAAAARRSSRLASPRESFFARSSSSSR